MASKHPPSKIYIAGHRGMVGSAILRKIEADFPQTTPVVRSSSELDLTRQAEVEAFFQEESPDVVIDAAARVGGIEANRTYRAEFIYTNLQIQNNLIHSAWKAGVEKFIFLASSCIYPRLCPQPMKEEHLWSGPLEPTNSPYAVAKLSGIEMCQAYSDQYGCDYFSVVPTNLYGPNDNYDPEQSHVMAALISKFHLAKTSKADQVTLWEPGHRGGSCSMSMISPTPSSS
jgi:GDP-L-fucose synthase